MESKKLCESCYCRLCAEENNNGMYLFSSDDNSEDLSGLINKYLPVKVNSKSLLIANLSSLVLVAGNLK